MGRRYITMHLQAKVNMLAERMQLRREAFEPAFHRFKYNADLHNPGLWTKLR
jgi:hypothetical protein